MGSYCLAMNPLQMDHEQSSVQEEDFGNHQWSDLGGYQPSQHPSQMHDFNTFGFIPPPPPSLHVAPMFERNIPPPYAAPQLIMPIPQWPSMMSAPTTYSTPILPATPITAPLSTSSATSHTLPAPTPRKTLTDGDRRRMCQYHEDNPTVKQTEIGALFGVERSTVSKVLRQKEKYLSMEDGSKSPIKRSKGKFPDIERALLNWTRNQKKHGIPITDQTLKEQARVFFATAGNSDSHFRISSGNWLEKFKHKHNILSTGTKSRNASISTDTDRELNSDLKTSSISEALDNGISPTSQSPLLSSPLSPSSKGRETGNKNESPDTMVDFYSGQSSTATPANNFSPPATAPLTSSASFFSPDPNVSSVSFNATPPTTSTGALAFSRPRSQTLPMLGIETSQPLMSPPSSSSSETLPPRLAGQVSVFESPIEEELSNADSISPRQLLKRNHSSPNVSTNTSVDTMRPPPPPQSAPPGTSTSNSVPKSSISNQASTKPTQDEARRALEIVMAFFQTQSSINVDPLELMTIGKLVQKLEASTSSVNALTGSASGLGIMGGMNMGGLHTIEEIDAAGASSRNEVEGGRVCKKRSIHSLS